MSTYLQNETLDEITECNVKIEHKTQNNFEVSKIVIPNDVKFSENHDT